MNLTSYASGSIPLLLKGSGNDVSMLADALELSKALLNTDNLEVHPDFLLVSSDKKTIGVEQAQEVVSMASRRPSVAKVSVCVIDGMDKLTVQAQNKLLLTLESSSYMRIIGISYKNSLLDTVLSRMKVVSYQPLSEKNFVEKFTNEGYSLEDATLFFQASDGLVALKEMFEENKDMFREVRNCILSDKRHFLLKSLHLLQEKDKEAVTGDIGLMKAVLRVIARNCCNKAVELCGKSPLSAAFAVTALYVNSRVTDVEKITFTKNDFFDIIVRVIELEG